MTPAARAGEAPSTTLDRRLGPIDAAAIVVSNVIGGGIFFLPIIVAGLVPDPRAILTAWLIGGVLAFAGAMAYAELAALRPRAGGEYVYLYDAYGPFAAFMTGWTSFVAGFSGAIAATSAAAADYLGRFIPAAGNTTPIFTVPIPVIPLLVSPRNLFALGLIAILTFVHVRGLGPGRLVQNTLAVAKVAALVVFVVVGFAIGRGSVSNFTTGAPFAATGILMALIPVMFTYAGWNAAAYVAEEVKSPGRNVPLALGLGTLVVIIIYLALNALYIYALTAAGLGTFSDARLIDRVAEALFGYVTGNVIAAFTIISSAASVSAMIIAGPRVYFAMARDGLFLKQAAVVHPRFRTPVLAIVAQSVWSGFLVLCGTIAQLASYTGFAIVLFSGIAVAGLFVLRRRHPDAPRPFRAWGYPWAPAVFVIASAVMLVNELWRTRGTALAGVAVIAAGIPVYWWLQRRK
jgi:basic amino acid/polyamine antiporter, APA family